MHLNNEIENYEDQGIDLSTFDKEKEIEKFKDVITAVGWTLFVRLYTAPKVVGGLLVPPSVRDDDSNKNCVGLVIQVSKGAYTDSRYDVTGPWCKEGDWIIFPRHAGYRMFVDNVPIWVLNEDALNGLAKDPTRISKYLY